MTSEQRKPSYENLTSDEIKALKPLSHSTAVEVEPGKHVAAQGYSGVIRGCQGSWWLTGKHGKRVGDTLAFAFDGRAY